MSGDDARAEAAARALAGAGPQAAAALVQFACSPEWEKRWWAVRALAGIPGEAARTAAMEALHDSEAAVRQCAAMALGSHPAASARRALAAALADPDPLTARLAGDSLAAQGEPAVEELAAAAASPAAGVRIQAVRALARLRHPTAISALFRALDDDSAVVAHWADIGLQGLGIGMVFFQP
jgi:HEAT repeat protein